MKTSSHCADKSRAGEVRCRSRNMSSPGQYRAHPPAARVQHSDAGPEIFNRNLAGFGWACFQELDSRNIN
jgi:hypothetical protein